MKHNDEHKNEGRKSVFWVLFIVSRQSYGSFDLSIEALVVVSLVPRPHLYGSGYEANLLT